MTKIKLTKRCYTSPQNIRTVNTGVYDVSDFSKEELEFLKSLNAVKYLQEEKVVIEEEAPIILLPPAKPKRRRSRNKKIIE